MSIPIIKFISEYSTDKGIIKFNKIIKLAKIYKIISLVITDKYNLSGAIEFYYKCVESNIKPLIGCTIKILIKKNTKINKNKITLIAKNKKGYKNLCKIINTAYYRENKIGILINYIKDISNYTNNNNIIIINNTNKKQTIYIYNKLIKSRINKKNIYTETNYKNKINNINHIINKNTINIQTIKFININDINKYILKKCITNKLQTIKIKNLHYKKLKNLLFKKKYSNNFNKNEKYIINNCNITFNKKPNFKNNIKQDKKLIKLTQKGFLKKYKSINKYNSILKRIKYEIKTIISMGYSIYFIIASNIIKWANKNKIMIGPGRGSSASSLICYLTNITKINPLKENLIFERFLNIKKKQIPDFDIDVCKKKRQLIIKHIINKFGRNCVTNIITFGRYAAKNAIKDCGKLLQYKYNYLNNIIKNIAQTKQNEPIKLIIKNNLSFKKKYIQNKNFKNLINNAINIEGTIKNLSIHASGIIITCTNFYNLFPIYIIKEKFTTIASQITKYSAEKLGLIKFDILGLNTLTIINNIIIKTNINYENINKKDTKTFNLICNGNTTGVFQLENFNLKTQLRHIKPKTINELTNILALYRPGPINLIKKYINKEQIKINNKNVDKYLKSILKTTNGIIIFQEQIINITKFITGFSLNEADLLRRDLINKNKKSIYINKFKKIINNKFDKKTCYKIKNIIKKFNGYSFNKAHAVSYTLITYLAAYLKANYKVKFFISHLNYSYENTNKMQILYKDIKKNKINLIINTINTSPFKFKENKKGIIYGLKAIKNINKESIKNIIKERETNKFKSIKDMIDRLKINLNINTIKTLILGGFLDCFKQSRNQLLQLTNKIKNITNKFKPKSIWDLLKKERNLIGVFKNSINKYKKYIPNSKIKTNYKIHIGYIQTIKFKNKKIFNIILEIGKLETIKIFIKKKLLFKKKLNINNFIAFKIHYKNKIKLIKNCIKLTK